MEGTYPHCLCVRSVLAWIRPLYTGILHTHTHAFSSFTRVYLSCAGWRRLSSSLFRATVDYLTQLSVVPSWANPSSTSSSSSSCSTRSIFSPPLVSFAIVSSRPYRFVVYTPRFRPIVTGMKSGRRWEEGWRGGERKRVRLTILSLSRGDSFPLAEFTRPGHRLTVKGITEIVFEIFLLLLFLFLVVSRFESVSVFLPVGLSTQLLIIVLSRVDNIVTFRKISRGNWRRSEGIAPSKDRYPRSQHPLRCSLPENYAHLGR